MNNNKDSELHVNVRSDYVLQSNNEQARKENNNCNSDKIPNNDIISVDDTTENNKNAIQSKINESQNLDFNSANIIHK